MLLPTFARILRVSRAVRGLAEPSPPAWLRRSRRLIRSGTSVATWYRYEAGAHCPRAHVILALADAYGPMLRGSGDRRSMRAVLIARLCEAVRRDAERLVNAAPTATHGDVLGARLGACRRLRPVPAVPRQRPARFPRFGALLASRRVAIGVSIEAMRSRFPDWLEAAMRRLSSSGNEECLLASTLWRFEMGESLPNALVFGLLPDVYGLQLSELVDAIDEDVAGWLSHPGPKVP